MRPAPRRTTSTSTTSLLVNLFVPLGDTRTNVRAGNLNTIDEVPDSSWFTNRIYAAPVTAADVARGPNTIDGPAPGRWTVIGAKTAGASPGFRIRDARGELWFVSLDARGIACARRPGRSPSRAGCSGRSATTRSRITSPSFRRTISTSPRRRRSRSGRATSAAMKLKDLDGVLARGEKSADGSYRAMAARALPGRILGGFPLRTARVRTIPTTSCRTSTAASCAR